MPRPDVHRLGVKYRRTPLLAIGRDVYLDTRLIITKLSEVEPGHENARLSVATTPEQLALQHLLHAYVMNTGFTANAIQLIALHNKAWMDPAFIKDRTELIGTGAFFSDEVLKQTRPEAIRVVRSGFDFLERTLLSDGREWLLGTKGPSIGDLDMAWSLLWMERVPGAIPEEWISKEIFPKVFAWMERFKDAATQALEDLGTPTTLTGDEAAQLVLGSEYHEVEGQVDEGDALVQLQGLKKGQLIRVWPTDTGSNHKELGELVSLDAKEVVIEAKAEEGGSVRIHAQRHGFAVTSYEE
ncbi:glutathione s-transferase [Trichoderma arundinaceum]|uniref:Glutathione s-transferase n=1 Tax=Trichoderma arundinaceum TaxID=490622 RepID=A0A395N9Q0_TRIAR|nr:glutathione s-transferase [Trichoderma arundinaceum]